MKYLKGKMVIRLTKNEMSQLENLPCDTKFYHVNLQHSGIPYRDFEYQYYYAAKLQVPGKDTILQKVDPILDTSKFAFLELISISHSLPIKNIKNSDLNIKKFLLENKKGIYASVWDKYKDIRDLNKKEFNEMKVYIREFKLIKFEYPN